MNLRTREEWKAHIPRDIFLPNIADVESYVKPVYLDLQYSEDGESLELLCWPNDICCRNRESPLRAVIGTCEEWISGVLSKEFGVRTMQLAKRYHEWVMS